MKLTPTRSLPIRKAIISRMSPQENTPPARKRAFKPARPNPLVIKAAQEFVRAELLLKNHVNLNRADLKHLNDLPEGTGLVLASNHADETDPRVVIELSRQTGKRMISMCNREAFDESFGLAGWALQRLGHFSVERGAHDANAKTFAIDVIRQGKDVLVIFPEGEIFYLNESVQPFHTGAIDLTMQAILEQRKTDRNWTAHIVPMAIKYHYDKSVEPALWQRIEKMERRLSLKPGESAASPSNPGASSLQPGASPSNPGGSSLPERLHAIQQALLARREKSYGISEDESAQNLEDQIISARRKILSNVEEKYHESLSPQKKVIDESWRLGAELRERLEEQREEGKKADLRQDIAILQEVAQLASWNPKYYEGTHSFDRMAEAVIKLERELYRIKRPLQLAHRKVFVKLARPFDLGPFVDEYISDAHSTRKELTAQLQKQVQSLVDELAASCSR